MANGKERAANILRGPDGKQMYLQLVQYAQTQAGIRGWRVGTTLPGSESPRAVVSGVVAKLLDPSGGRTWDEQKEPSLLNALKGMVRSEIGHLYDRVEESLVEPINRSLPDGEERTADYFATDELDPEQELLRKERKKLEDAAMTLVLREAEGNPELESVVLAMCDTDSPSEIAKRTGLPIERVYAARRDLTRIVRKITLARVIGFARGGGDL